MGAPAPPGDDGLLRSCPGRHPLPLRQDTQRVRAGSGHRSDPRGHRGGARHLVFRDGAVPESHRGSHPRGSERGVARVERRRRLRFDPRGAELRAARRAPQAPLPAGPSGRRYHRGAAPQAFAVSGNAGLSAKSPDDPDRRAGYEERLPVQLAVAGKTGSLCGGQGSRARRRGAAGGAGCHQRCCDPKPPGDRHDRSRQGGRLAG